jgi:hypothetical protein
MSESQSRGGPLGTVLRGERSVAALLERPSAALSTAGGFTPDGGAAERPPTSALFLMDEANAGRRVVVDASGEVTEGAYGNEAEALAERIAYLARLAQLVGKDLGSGTPRRFHFKGETGSLQIAAGANGTLIATLQGSFATHGGWDTWR